jgi:hypothetical protein
MKSLLHIIVVIAVAGIIALAVSYITKLSWHPEIISEKLYL